jgi:hypothetical protein
MFNGAFAKILEAQKITIRLLANFANSLMPSTLKARYTLVVSCSFSIGISSGSSGVGAINGTSAVSRAGRLIAQGDELAAERSNPGN